MRVLGIDGGMTRLGIGAVELKGDELRLITYGLIQNPRGADEKFNAHLNAGIKQIVDDFPKLLDMITPSIIVSETIPAGKLGANDSLVIAAVTTCKVVAHQFGIKWYDIAAVTAKKQLTGDYRASKATVRNTVLDIFPSINVRHKQQKTEQKNHGEKMIGLPQDCFDAIGIAVVGANIYGREQSLSEVPEA